MADGAAQRLLSRVWPPGRLMPSAPSRGRTHHHHHRSNQSGFSFSFSFSFSSSSTYPWTKRPPHERFFPAYFVRGGTSNGLVIREDALPPFRSAATTTAADAIKAREAAWTPVLASAMGSPDPDHGRQLDGMGSGVSSTSKICVIAPPRTAAERADRDVDFTFVQVGIRDGRLDLAGNCGNMISAVGPLAFDLGFGGTVEEKEKKEKKTAEEEEREGGWVDVDGDVIHENGDDRKTALVRIFNTNTNKMIHARFRVAGSPPRYYSDGDYAIDGVPGTHSRITLSFLRPVGAKSGAQNGLPSGRPVDMLSRRAGEAPSIPASLVDVSNPGVFVLGGSLGLGKGLEEGHDAKGTAVLREVAAAIEADEDLKAMLDHLRRQGASRMGMDPDTESVPKIVLLFPPPAPPAVDADTGTATPTTLPAVDIRCVALSMGQVHKAIPLTLALCLGAAARIPSTLAAQLIEDAQRNSASTSANNGYDKERRDSGSSAALVIGHPSGRVEVGTTLDETDGTILSADLHRTARVMMEGNVFF